MIEAVDLMWASADPPSLEHFRYRTEGDVRLFEGDVALSRNGAPSTVQYRLDLERDWAFRVARVSISGAGRQVELYVRRDGDDWNVNGKKRPDLAGCIDIDLGWSPSTNTLPIRRTNLGVGESTTVDAAWLKFPDLIVDRSQQTYTRNTERSWTYSSGEFTAKLETDNHGLVRRYGDGIWTTVASWEKPFANR